MSVTVHIEYEPAEPDVGILADGWLVTAEAKIGDLSVSFGIYAEYAEPVASWTIESVTVTHPGCATLAEAAKHDDLLKVKDIPVILPYVETRWAGVKAEYDREIEHLDRQGAEAGEAERCPEDDRADEYEAYQQHERRSAIHPDQGTSTAG